MAEFFLELFSEEIPANLQRNLRKNLLEEFNKFFFEKSIKFSKSFALSTPNRLVIVFSNVDKQIKILPNEIKGPKTDAPEQAINGFIRSNKIEKKELIRKETEKGEFYFYKTKLEILKIDDLLKEFIPKVLEKHQWQKSMRWGETSLYWGRPLKSVLCVFNQKVISFKLQHILSSNQTFIDQDLEDKKKTFVKFKTYEKFLLDKGIIIDQKKRESIINKKFTKILNKEKLLIKINPKLFKEVVNLVDKPNILICSFDKKFLSMPKEILILTMQVHQKYFPTFDSNDKITNKFLIVINKKDKKGLIKIGNERVIEARLSDAEFFWNKDKSQNLVKKVSELKSINFFNGLGTYFDKVQRMRKLGGMVSDELFISREKVELSASISKTDLTSNLVKEFPELQGIMGGYFSEYQGFDKDISLALSEQYLPVGLETKVPKKPFSLVLSITDKIDTLVGFFGINEKPSSSKDPFGLRRIALSIIRIIIENKKDLKLSDYLNYSSKLYFDQGCSFSSKELQKELNNFLRERFRFYLKEKQIRLDIIDATISSFSLNKIFSLFEKARCLNKHINGELGLNLISTYKRASNILENEMKNNELEINTTPDQGLFKNDYEKKLFKKISDMQKYFSKVDDNEIYEVSLKVLAESKKEVFDFLDNVKVNEENEILKKNRLKLVSMICKTFQNYINFQILKNE